jgi:hypothetical protein
MADDAGNRFGGHEPTEDCVGCENRTAVGRYGTFGID